MAITDDNTIQITISKPSPYKEYIALEPIMPGQLVMELNDSTCRLHDVQDGFAEALYAVENPYSGGDITDTYPTGSRVMVRLCRPGDVILVWCREPASKLIRGDYLFSNGDGWVFNHTLAGTPYVVGMSDGEDIDTGADRLILMQISRGGML